MKWNLKTVDETLAELSEDELAELDRLESLRYDFEVCPCDECMGIGQDGL